MKLASLCLIGGLVCLLGFPVSAQVYKCKSATGSIAMQQTPCSGQGEMLNVRPASGHASPQVSPAASDSSAPAVAPLKNMYARQLSAAQEDRTRREGWFDMRDKKRILEKVLIQCQEEQLKIDSEKIFSLNNLAGATRDVSISNQMLAAATACDSKIRSAQNEVDSAVAMCDKLKCISSE